jgi:hypothetical protein
MRRFVALLLLVLLPLQAVWAAAAPYCQHEGGAASHHIGHHQPEHHADAAQPSSADGEGHHDGTNGAGAEHSDCHVCHGGTVLAHEVRLARVMSTTTQPVPTVAHGLPAPPGERPERPKWPALA